MTSATIPVAVARLRVLLGGELVAYLARCDERAQVRAWENHEEDVPPLAAARIICASELASLIAERHGADAAQRWLCGCDCALPRAPLLTIRRARSVSEFEPLLASARLFASSAVLA